MQMRPPEIRQILSLSDNAQALAVKKVAKRVKKAAGNEWTIIPPSLNCTGKQSGYERASRGKPGTN